MDAPSEDTQGVLDPERESVAKRKRTYGRKREATAATTSESSTSLSARLKSHHLPSDDEGAEEEPEASPELSEVADFFGWRRKMLEFDEDFDKENGKGGTALSPAVHLRESTSSNSASTDASFSLFDVSLSSGANQLPSSQTDDPPSPTLINSEAKGTPATSDTPPPKQEISSVIIRDDPDAEDTSPPRTKRTAVHRAPMMRKKGTPAPASDNEETSDKAAGIKASSGKIKKPTLKEKELSLKEHARIIAEQKVSILKAGSRYSMDSFLAKLSGETSGQPSDPIQEFTSSPQLGTDRLPVEATLVESHHATREDASDEEMPDAQQLLAEEKRKKELARRKRIALQQRQLDDEDDSEESDLEIEPPSAKKKTRKTGTYEKKLACVAGFRVGRSGVLEGSQGDATIQKASRSTFTSSGPRDKPSQLNHRELQRALLVKAEKQGRSVIKEKEDEWERRGGKLQRNHAQSGNALTIADMARDLAREKVDGGGDVGGEAFSESEDAEDEEYVPDNRGSASPVGGGSVEASDDENEQLRAPLGSDEEEVQQTTFVDEDVSGGEARRSSVRHNAQRMLVPDSDDEDSAPKPTGRVFVPQTSLILDDIERRSSVYSEGASDKENRENDTRSSTESNGDKENAMPLSPRSPAGPRGFLSQRSRSSALLSLGEGSPKNRRPLQDRKLSDHDPFYFGSPRGTDSPCGSPKASRSLSRTNSPRDPKPLFGGSLGGFSQFFDETGSAPPPVDENTPVKSTLKPAFQEKSGDNVFLEPSFEPKSVQKGGLSDFFSQTQPKATRFGGLGRSGDDLSLSLDTNLQPALSVTTQMRRKADALFEKEQEFALEEAATSATSSSSKPELYIGENGMLTQTKPDGATPLVYRTWTPSQKTALGSQATAPPTTGPRVPLGELPSFTTDSPDITSPIGQRLTRLRKGKEPEVSSPLDSPAVQRNPDAFRQMMEAQKRKDERQKVMMNSEFVDRRAVESDEEDDFGFKSKNRDGDEDSEDDPDEIIENLVDDAQLNEDQLARDKVLEKAQEHQDEEDAAREKYHRDAIEGKFRSKRRGGINMDDSDSGEESDGYENRRRRDKMYKKRRIEGDTLEALGRDEKSRPYYDAYQKDVQMEDDEDFRHLAQDTADVDEEEENENDPRPVEISTTDLKAQLLEASRRKREEGSNYQVFDADNVGWADAQANASDEEYDVTEVEGGGLRRPQIARRLQGDNPEFDDMAPQGKNRMDESQRAQLEAWKREQGNRAMGTGGLKGAITVTGHGKSGSGSRSGLVSVASASSRTMQRSSAAERSQPRKLAKSASILASVSGRQSRFG